MVSGLFFFCNSIFDSPFGFVHPLYLFILKHTPLFFATSIFLKNSLNNLHFFFPAYPLQPLTLTLFIVFNLAQPL